MRPEKSTLFPSGKHWKRKVVVVSVVLLAIIASLAAMYAISASSAAAKADEFYLLSKEGTTRNYPRTVSLGEPVMVKAVITNHQSTASVYTIKVMMQGNELASSAQIQLNANETRQMELSFLPRTMGMNQKVEFLLFRANDGAPLSELYLWIDVVK